MTFIVGFLPLTIFIASFVNKKAVWALTGFDLLCGALSIVGLVLWYITKSGNIAIIFSILETESAWPYLASTISAILTLLSIMIWNVANVGFPLYIVLITLVIVSLVQFKLGKQIRFMLDTTV